MKIPTPLHELRLAVLAFVACGLAAAEKQEDGRLGESSLVRRERVMAVNGDAVTAREFVEAMRRHRFRTNEAATLREAAREDVVRFKVTLQLARAHGLAADSSDAALRELFRKENERRAQGMAAGAPVFGPRQLTWAQFRAHWLNGIERELSHAVNDKAGAATEAELREFYRANPKVFTAPKQKTPEPFEAVRGHVVDTYRKHRYTEAVRAAVARAKVETDGAWLERLRPEMTLPGEEEPRRA